MIRYIATLIPPPGTTLPRPVQCFGNDLPTLESWAELVLESKPGFHVQILEHTAVQVKIILPKPVEKVNETTA